ncbi:potassium uptake protein, TrkH family [Ruminiclostridium cellulolyticum H10]|uniref:Potassium uptake protein, TrkH family n=1 Tax=Ruminiclostridium cellulolyticum (strain ATCC 35319 / DSM 5812 / JCM 6584 / H10) TaxID=394503 RepID=B8I3Z2_RUMCH|nr:potassium uptake protein, TrkH family [Ruminiclostridium cellulolyticum H10]
MLNIAPSKLLVLSFAVLILTGAILLSMPFSSRTGEWTPFINALFTSTSASCITGLITYDTYTYWSTAGQIIILALIQVGALGIITLATFFSLLLKKKVGLKGMLIAQESINSFRYDEVLKLVRRIVTTTLLVEFIGAIVLSLSFVPKFGAFGLYMSIFHSISAFCNAGFDITSGAVNGKFLSITPFNNDPIVIYTISGLIIFGGLGFTVWRDLYEFRKNKALLFHTKLVLVITSILLIFGTLFFFANEYNNSKTLGPMSLFEKINAAFFQSTAARTAGFNSINLADMKEISKVFSVFLMFVGAAPGSTGGGIKVTTFGVIMFAVFSQIKGSGDVVLFKRKLHQYTVNKALSITGLSATLVILITTVIVTLQSDLHVLDILYEATSAFGTVGLTLGQTPSLNTVSKILIIMTMFLGRVGPLSFAVALTLKSSKRTSDIVYPEAKILVG